MRGPTGTVTAVGEKVKSVAVGDRVVCSWGTHSQVIHLKESRVQKIGEASFEEAALWHIATFPMAAIRKCGLEIGESAVVMGLGILGMMAVGLLHAAGAVPVIAVDPIEEKRKQALDFGADYALDPFEEGFAERVKELTGKGANVAIEVTGNGKALDQVLDAMAKMGRVALLGCTRHSDFTIDYYRKVHSPGISLIGAHTMARPKKESSRGLWTDRDDIFACRKLFERGRIRFSELLQESYSPAEAPEVYRRLAQEKSFPVTQFDWRKLP